MAKKPSVKTSKKGPNTGVFKKDKGSAASIGGTRVRGM